MKKIMLGSVLMISVGFISCGGNDTPEIDKSIMPAGSATPSANNTLTDSNKNVQILNAGGTVDAIEIAVDDGVEPAAVHRAIEQMLPARTEVVTGQEVADEAADGINSIIDVFGTGLLVFAFVTALGG